MSLNIFKTRKVEPILPKEPKRFCPQCRKTHDPFDVSFEQKDDGKVIFSKAVYLCMPCLTKWMEQNLPLTTPVKE